MSASDMRVHQRGGGVGGSSSPTRHAAVGTTIMMFYYMYTCLVQKSLMLFDCTAFDVNLEQPVWYMDADPSVECYQGAWMQLVPVSIVTLICYALGVPICFAVTFVMYNKIIVKDQQRRLAGKDVEGIRWRINEAATKIQAHIRGHMARRTLGTGSWYQRYMANPLTIIHVRERFGKLYEDYKPKFYWYKLVIMLRKVLLMMVIFFNDPLLEAAWAILVLFISFYMHARLNPYLKRPTRPRDPEEEDEEYQARQHKGVVSLFGGLRKKKKKGGHTGAAAGISAAAQNRWKKAILVVRTQVRWRQVVVQNGKDLLWWLFDYNQIEGFAISANILMVLLGLIAAGTRSETGSCGCSARRAAWRRSRTSSRALSCSCTPRSLR